MKKYIVIRPFSDMGVFRKSGGCIETDDNRAAKLRAMGLIGGLYEASVLEAPEKAIKAEKDTAITPIPENRQKTAPKKKVK